MRMATLQLKNVPDEVHAELRRRADAEHVSLRDYVLRLLLRELELPTMAEWLAEVRADDPVLGGPASAELVALGRADAE
jgi:plasmid stability protein